MLSYVFYGLTSLIGIVSSSLGIGGGCLLLSLFMHYTESLEWLRLEYVAPLVTTTVLSNNLLRSGYYIFKRHDIHEEYRLIDYSVMSVMAPFDTLGSYIGIIVNDSLNYTNIKFLTISVFITICIKLVLRLLKKESVISVYNIPLVYEEKLNFFPQLGMYLSLLSLDVIGYHYLSLVGYILVGLYSVRYNIVKQSSPNIVWSVKNSVFVCIGSILIGFVSTLIGIGGSMISTPMLLNLNFKPNVIISTNSLSGLFSTISSTIQYYRRDRILIDKSINLFIVNFFSCIVGTYLSLRLQKKNDKVYTSFLLLLVIFCSYIYILRL